MINTDEEKQKLYAMNGVNELGKGLSDYGLSKTQSYMDLWSGKQALKLGQRKAANTLAQGKSLISQNMMNASASGIDPNTGSAAEINKELTKRVERDSQEQLLQGKYENIDAKFKATQARIAGQSKLAGSLMSAGSSFMSAYNMGNQ